MRRLNFERAAILTPEAKAQFESIWARAEAAMDNCVFMDRVHSIGRQVYWGSVKMQKEAVKRAVFEAWRVCQNVTRMWSLAGMRLQRQDWRQTGWADRCSHKIRLGGSREGRPGSGRRRLPVSLVRFGILSDSLPIPRKRGDRNQWRSLQLKTGLLC